MIEGYIDYDKIYEMPAVAISKYKYIILTGSLKRDLLKVNIVNHVLVYGE